MRLYTDGNGGWEGTQDDANERFGRRAYNEDHVPTSKADLLAFLNDRKVAGDSVFPAADPVAVAPAADDQNQDQGGKCKTCAARDQAQEEAVIIADRASASIDSLRDFIATADLHMLGHIAQAIGDRYLNVNRKIAA